MGLFDSFSSGVSSFAADPLGSISKLEQSTVKQVSGFASSLGSLTNMSNMRLGIAGLLGGSSTARKAASNTQWLNSSGQLQCSGPSGGDWRLRVSVAPGSQLLYDDNEQATLLGPLTNTNGVIFPITPNINVTHSARYSSISPTHSNYAMQFYEGSEVAEIQINGEFPIQNNTEGQYLIAAIYFFRAATKMFWGAEDNAGAPPPLLFLDGYGSHYFPHVPCVLKSFTHTLPHDVDYIEVMPLGQQNVTRLPTQSQIQITLQPIYSRSKLSTFTASDFANGDLLSGGFM